MSLSAIDYLQKGRTISGEYYTNLLYRFNEYLRKKCGRQEKSSFSSRVQECYERYELLPHPQYFPDLAPSDYFLFPNLNKWLGGNRFYSNDEIISQTNTYFEDLEKSYLLEGIQKLEKRWTKCIELKSDYIEK